ncbi:LysR family transcriptional regulator, partial [Lactobacillus sp. PSON]|uniref:LysR family transcriptional regulator n=1 Tax=Lactobacillus sp. PSON TaxID=3455454 RepID=UPI00404143B6
MLESERRLHYIDTILKYSSFNKAAHELYITQPYLTQIIQEIERKKVGTTIINRSQRPYSLTNAGRIYYNYLERISYDTQELDKELIPYTHPNQKLIRIGILESLGTILLPKLLPSFLDSHPEVEVQLFESSPQKNEKDLLKEEIDCYIGQNPETLTQGANYVANGTEQYYIIIPSKSSFYKKSKFILNYS